MVKLYEILKVAVERKCSDVYLSVGAKIFGRIDSKLEIIFDYVLNQNDTLEYSKEILEENFYSLDAKGDLDSSFSISGLGRFRVNIFKQRSSVAMTIRIVSLNNFENSIRYSIPDSIFDYISSLNKGLVLVNGTSGSGRSTTICSILEKISVNYSKHIITVESPIEILYRHNNSVINQREVGSDTKSYSDAIEATFKETPDILVIDNIDNFEILKLVFKCCDAGMVVISSMYSDSVKNTIDNLIEMANGSANINFRDTLSNVLKCVITQKIILDNASSKFCLFEIMFSNPGISTCIRENKLKHIEPLIQNNSKLGMCTFDMSLIEAYKSSKISRSILLQNISNKELAAKIILNY